MNYFRTPQIKFIYSLYSMGIAMEAILIANRCFFGEL